MGFIIFFYIYYKRKFMLDIKEKIKNFLILEYVDSIIDEEYPSSFDREHFKSLSSYNSRVKYCEEHLTRIASGSARIVYQIDNEKVLKLAKNKKGLAQNEIEASHSQYYDLENVLARTFDADQNDLWVEMELARKVRVADFKRIVGFDFKDYCKAIHNYDNEANNRRRYDMDIDPEILKDMWEDEFIYDIFQYIAGYEIPAGDLMRLNSYGLVKRNGQDAIVIIDFGLDNDVYTSYYS